MDKLCSTCGILKPQTDYNWRNKLIGRLHSYCKTCQSARNKVNYHKNGKEQIYKKNKEIKESRRKFIYDYLSNNPCVICGESDPVALDFDHTRDKVMNVSEMVSKSHSIKRIKSEIEKCQVLCANCHRKKTAKDFGWYKSMRDSANG